MPVKFVGKAKLTKQGQVTLPFEAREDLNIRPDEDVYWYMVDGHLVVVKDLVSIEELEKLIKKRK